MVLPGTWPVRETARETEVAADTLTIIQTHKLHYYCTNYHKSYFDLRRETCLLCVLRDVVHFSS